jgi:hypothetical protein
MAAFTSCACAVATWFVTYADFTGATMMAWTESSSPWASGLIRPALRDLLGDGLAEGVGRPRRRPVTVIARRGGVSDRARCDQTLELDGEGRERQGSATRRAGDHAGEAPVPGRMQGVRLVRREEKTISPAIAKDARFGSLDGIVDPYRLGREGREGRLVVATRTCIG